MWLVSSSVLIVIVCLLFQVLLNDGKTERIILAHHSSVEPRQEAVTEYRVLGPQINGCSWVELRPLTYRKHQVSWKQFCFLYSTELFM